MNTTLTDPIFALLDDSGATPERPSSRLYTGFVRQISCRPGERRETLLADLQQALQTGLHAVGLFDYEDGVADCGVMPAAMAAAATAPPSRPSVLLFARCQRLSATQVDIWLAQQAELAEAGQPAEARCAGVASVVAEVDRPAFDQAIARIQAYLAAGDAYQVNYTYRLRFIAYGSVLALYRKLRHRQPVPFGALIMLPDGAAVLSFSPELFLCHEDGRLTARPMKGTAAASGDPALDAERSASLARDEKNRAENLMIVDLLRNDLGRIADIGSVTVPALFKVAAYGSVLQMTSTIQATLRPDVALAEVFAALFPCGSITGAPKRRSMQIIRELEGSARGLYTGAIGWFEPAAPPRRIGNFTLSVPIRTLLLAPVGADGSRRGEMGVGAGIVHDSRAASEHAECQLKARFLVESPADFDLFETLYATREAGCRHVELHLQRLCTSAVFLGFAHGMGQLRAQLRAALQSACRQLPPSTPSRVRLTLAHNGTCTTTCAPLQALPALVRVLLTDEALAVDRMLLRHKISLRTQNDRAWQSAEAHGAFDMLFQNQQGELTEGARSNLFLRLDGSWYTPPLEAGLLPGIMRSVLLADPQWRATERRLTVEDLVRAEQVVMCSALRGVLVARVERFPQAVQG